MESRNVSSCFLIRSGFGDFFLNNDHFSLNTLKRLVSGEVVGPKHMQNAFESSNSNTWCRHASQISSRPNIFSRLAHAPNRCGWLFNLKKLNKIALPFDRPVLTLVVSKHNP